MGMRTILVNCKKCNKLMRIQIDEEVFADETKEILTVVHAHGDLADAEPHAVIVEIDRNFIIRDTKIPNQFVNSFGI